MNSVSSPQLDKPRGVSDNKLLWDEADIETVKLAKQYEDLVKLTTTKMLKNKILKTTVDI